MLDLIFSPNFSSGSVILEKSLTDKLGFNNVKSKLVLYFHNDPLEMNGSKKINDRLNILSKVERIVFNSEWSKKRFLTGMNKIYFKSKKLLVIYQSTNKVKINLKKKIN